MRQQCQLGVWLIADESVELYIVLDGLRFLGKVQMQSIYMGNVENVGDLLLLSPHVLEPPRGHVASIIQHDAYLRVAVCDFD